MIDSLRQTLGLQCDCTLVRADLRRDFSEEKSNEPRYQVGETTYLDIRWHWKAILASLFKHSTSAPTTSLDVNDYRIIALSTQGADRGAHGAVEGTFTARHTLVIVNEDDMHFDPCLRIMPE